MILHKPDWLGSNVDHYMHGFLAPKTESGIIVGVSLADPPTDFILDLLREDGSVRQARASMCLVGESNV